MFIFTGVPIVETAIVCGLGRLIFDGVKKAVSSKNVNSIQIPAVSEDITMPANNSSNPQTESPPALVNPLGEPLNTSISDLGNRPKNGSNSSSSVSSVKPRCEISDLRVGKSSTGGDWAYILPGIDKERQAKYGEVVYEPHIYHPEVIRIESIGRPKWGFLVVEKLPRWRKIVRGIAGFVTLVGGTALLTPFVGTIPAAIISGAAAIGVRKLCTLGRSVHFEAETARLHLTNGSAPKRDYDVFERLVREATHKVVSSADVSVCLQH